MTADRKPTAGFWITVALVALLVAYSLSIGPVEWLDECVLSNPVPIVSGARKIAYAPIYAMIKRSAAVENTWLRYMSLWGVPDCAAKNALREE